MAPISKQGESIASVALPKRTTRLSTRTSTSSASSMFRKITLHPTTKDKRKADQLSPPKDTNSKRSALCDITNAKKEQKGKPCLSQPLKTLNRNLALKPTTSKVVVNKVRSSLRLATQEKENQELVGKAKQVVKIKETEVKAKKGKEEEKKVQEKIVEEKVIANAKVVIEEIKVSIKVDSDATKTTDEDSSLYASALETLSQDDSLVIITPLIKEREAREKALVAVNVNASASPRPPVGVDDFDLENIDDPLQVSIYAMDIFNYLKSKEKLYHIGDYMAKQTVISKWMRSLLVDWMVDVQEHFELNHETLYLAVKILDLYLSKKSATKETLQLVGAGAMFLAAKFDERIPPLIEDFLYVCENVYTREQLVKMEIELFRVVDFCLGMPISYRFLRRYARCCKTSMPILTLARYVLELALMEYGFVSTSESQMACAALYLALKMTNSGDWSPALEYYSGYKLNQFKELVYQFNDMLHRKPREQLKTVRTKYSHKIFFEVAMTPLLDNSKL